MTEATGYVKGQPTPIKLSPIDDKGHYLEANAALYFMQMSQAAHLDGVLFQINSAFRDHDKQSRLYEAYRKAINNWIAAGKKGPEPTPAAKPGYSLHESGLAVDINADEKPKAWLFRHAEMYHFKNTVWNEPWHWEFKP